MPKRRITKQQVIGKLGERCIAKELLSLGWQPKEMLTDLGEDLIVDIYDESGSSTGMAFYAQVKSAENLALFKLKDGNFSYPLEVKDLEHWRDYIPPVVLFLWDSKKQCGYWITVSEVLKTLDEKSIDWKARKKVHVCVPQDNTLSSESLKRLRHSIGSSILPVIKEGKQLEMRLNFSFPETEEGRAENAAMQRFFATGESVTVSGQHISELRLSEWYERIFGTPQINRKGKITFGPRRSEQIEKIRLTLFSPQGTIAKVQVIDVKAIRAGEEQVTFSNEHNPTPFLCNITLNISGNFFLNISLKGSKSTGTEALAAYEFFDRAHRGGSIRVEALTNPRAWGKWKKLNFTIPEGSFRELSEAYYHLLQKVSLIEKRSGLALLLTDEGINEETRSKINYVTDIIEKGHLASPFKHMKVTLDGPETKESYHSTINGLLKLHSQNKIVSFDINTSHIEFDILGTTIPVGPQRVHLNGYLSPECVENLKRTVIHNGYSSELIIELVHGNIIEEFSDWLKTPPTLPPIGEK